MSIDSPVGRRWFAPTVLGCAIAFVALAVALPLGVLVAGLCMALVTGA